MKKIVILGLIPLFILIIIPKPLFASGDYGCDPIGDTPVWGEAIIDGNITDWDLTTTYFADLHPAGKPWKSVTAKLYVMYNYDTNIMSVLVLNEPGHITDGDRDPEEFWIKYFNGTLLLNGNDSNFAFFNDGWEAKFYYQHCGCKIIQVHHAQEDEETSANYWVPVYMDCALPVELSSFTAEGINGNAVLNWITESEIDNQGFVIERREPGYGWMEIASFLTHKELAGQGSVTFSTNYEYIDNLVSIDRTYEYRLADVDYNGYVTYHSVRTITALELEESMIPDRIAVKQAYPNPFNPSTTIEYAIPKDGFVKVIIFDMIGQQVSSLVNTGQSKGWHKVLWNGIDDNGKLAPAGIYFATISTGNSIKTMKLIFVK